MSGQRERMSGERERMSGERRPKVVAVVLDWNGRDHTVACVRSLAALGDPRLDVLVVDNGSLVGAASALIDAGLAVPMLYTGLNLGYAGGNNVGVARALAAGADFVWVINNDACVRAGALDALLADAEAFPRAGAFGCRVVRGDDPTRIWVAWGRVTWRQSLVALDGEGCADGPEFAASRDVEWLPGCSILFRAEAWREVGGFDEAFFAYHEDVDWAARAAAKGWTCRYVGAACVVHEVHGSSGGAAHYGGFRKYLSARNSVLYARRHGRLGERLRLAVWIVLTLPLQFLRRAATGEAAGVWMKVRGWRDGLAGRDIPFEELGLRPPRSVGSSRQAARPQGR